MLTVETNTFDLFPSTTETNPSKKTEEKDEFYADNALTEYHVDRATENAELKRISVETVLFPLGASYQNCL